MSFGADTQIVIDSGTGIMGGTEEVYTAEEPSDGGEPHGGVASVDPANNLTYIDVLITSGSGSGGGGSGNGPGGGGAEAGEKGATVEGRRHGEKGEMGWRVMGRVARCFSPIRDQVEPNLPEGRRLLAGDSARSHRLQAGSDVSRESHLESEREVARAWKR